MRIIKQDFQRNGATALDQLIPWLWQWHNHIDPVYGERMGECFVGFLAEECQTQVVRLEAVRAWRPPATGRGRCGQ